MGKGKYTMIIRGSSKSKGLQLLKSKLEPELARQDGVIINWGVSGGEGLNHAPYLGGLAQLEKFQAAQISHPVFTTNPQEVLKWIRSDMDRPFARKVDHSQGKDVWSLYTKTCKRIQQGWTPRMTGPFWEADYWVQFVPSVEEWRIHVFQGKSIARGKKVLQGEPWRHLQVRSRNNGWRLDHTQTPPKGLRKFAKSMVAAVGYDFGACDILVCPDGGYCALEVNKAPGLDEYTATAYAEACKRLVYGEELGEDNAE